jgi:hypothetical protein
MGGLVPIKRGNTWGRANLSSEYTTGRAQQVGFPMGLFPEFLVCCACETRGSSALYPLVRMKG